MLFNKKAKSEVDIEQHELLEHAQRRITQKRRLFTHFVIFLIGAVFLVLINKILKVEEQYNWFLWAILAWGFLFVFHVFNVFITQKFMGKDWERNQREKLVAKQKQRINELQKEIETEFPLSNVNKKKEL